MQYFNVCAYKSCLIGALVLFTAIGAFAQTGEVTVDSSQPLTGSQTITAINSIATDGTVTIPTGASITFQAGIIIDLKSGFSVQNGAAFHGLIINSGSTAAPIIVSQPIAQSIVSGSTASFSAVAVGTGPLTYQWRKNGLNIPGAVASSYVIAATTITDAGTFSVVVANSAGGATSRDATLTVNAPPAIVGGPLSQTAYAGTTVSFTITVSGCAPFTYQWQKNGVNINGANSAAFTIVNVQTDSGGSYTVFVTNAFGSATSTAAQLAIGASASDGGDQTLKLNVHIPR
jgi:hypothetical protein